MHKIFQGDCLTILPSLESHSIDLICVDLPYGLTNNKWDEIIPLVPLWECFKHVLKTDGCVVLTAAQPFTSLLVISNKEWFKYDMVWRKTIASGQLNVNSRPLRLHEDILVFAPHATTYNEQKTAGPPYKIKRSGQYKSNSYQKQVASEKTNDGFRHAVSVIDMSNPRIKNGHPTAKPVLLLEHLIKTFSNSGDTVLDCCMGSGSTGMAAIKTGRMFIGVEKDPTYFKMAYDNLSETLKAADQPANMSCHKYSIQGYK